MKRFLSVTIILGLCMVNVLSLLEKVKNSNSSRAKKCNSHQYEECSEKCKEQSKRLCWCAIVHGEGKKCPCVSMGEMCMRPPY